MIYKNLVLFFDGCHKIYYADKTDTATVDQMKSWGYEPITGGFGRNLKYLWRESCGLRFVQPADLDSTKPEIEQGGGNVTEFMAELRRYIG